MASTTFGVGRSGLKTDDADSGKRAVRGPRAPPPPVGHVPCQGAGRQWLKAGVVGREQLTPTEEGTAQRRVISPALLNVALHGLEEVARVRYFAEHMRHAGRSDPGTPWWSAMPTT
ncbi:hypothetical protein [Streptomyces mirabilis]|uniref:hypothetical protein n=1 Tax=Streptomyces mirabilis TaxID=68239 RepID=UPI0036E8789E